MKHFRKVQSQRRIVLEELRKNADDLKFDLLADILSIEREHIDNKHGVKESIKTAIDRIADHDLSGERVEKV